MSASVDTLERELAELADILNAIKDDIVAMNNDFEQLLANWDKDEDTREHADWEAIN